jgi:TolA-binding protein
MTTNDLHLTCFLNIPQLERQGADIQSKVEELEALNQSMRDRDKLKHDQLSTFIRPTYGVNS